MQNTEIILFFLTQISSFARVIQSNHSWLVRRCLFQHELAAFLPCFDWSLPILKSWINKDSQIGQQLLPRHGHIVFISPEENPRTSGAASVESGRWWRGQCRRDEPAEWWRRGTRISPHCSALAAGVGARRAARGSASSVRQHTHFRFGIYKIKHRSRPKWRRTRRRNEAKASLPPPAGRKR